jgi:hypothetical protein
MSGKHNILSVRRVKRGNQLVFKTTGDLALYNEFIKGLEEGQEVEEFLDSLDKSGTKPQLAKIHACIKELANEIGYTFEEMKKEIKRRAGLAIGDLSTSDGYVKSFADCSIQELGGVIETIIEVGENVNINIRGHFPERS